jgi:4a-hydroxytetrahydrobiopterin dehydratase
MTNSDMLKTQQILDADLADWRKLAQALHGRFLTGDFVTGLRFLTAVAEAADALGHHPEVTLTDELVDLKVLSEDAVYRPEDGGPERHLSAVTERDLDLARRISEIAQEQDIATDPTAVAELELALDTADLAAVGPFWAAVLTGSADSREGDDVRDPTGQVPLLWFQHTDAHETPRQRFHIDLWVPHDVAEERIAAGVAAGGRVVDDKEAPAFVVLADPEGNKVCICTCLDR